MIHVTHDLPDTMSIQKCSMHVYVSSYILLLGWLLAWVYPREREASPEVLSVSYSPTKLHVYTFEVCINWYCTISWYYHVEKLYIKKKMSRFVLPNFCFLSPLTGTFPNSNNSHCFGKVVSSASKVLCFICWSY